MNAAINKLLILSFIIFLFNSILWAQPVSNEKLDEKLKSITGVAEKITITTSTGDVFFTGKEAENLLMRLKDKPVKFRKILSPNDVLFLNEGQNKMKKEVKVEEENGQKKVTITTMENGEEKTETFTGEDAEKILTELDKEDEFSISNEGAEKFIIKKKRSKNLNCLDDDDNIIILHNSEDDGKEIEVTVRNDGGKFNVRVEEKEDGKVKIKVYEGEEAEKFLQDEDDVKFFKIEIDEDEPNHMIFKTKKHINNFDKDADFEWFDKNDSTRTTKKIKMEIEDGVKKLTVTTTENGETKTETFEGDEAEKYLDKIEKEEKVKLKVNDDSGDKTIIIKRK